MKIAKFKLSRKTLIYAVVSVLLVVALVVSYAIGNNNGASYERQQASLRAQSALYSQARLPQGQAQFTSRGHFVLSGTVQSKNGKVLSVKTTANTIVAFVLTDYTSVVRKTGEKADPKLLKKDASVLVTADVDPKGTFSAQRARILN